MRRAFSPVVRESTAADVTEVLLFGCLDGSLETLFPRLWVRLKVLWTPRISCYLEPMLDHENVKGAIMDIHINQSLRIWLGTQFSRPTPK